MSDELYYALRDSEVLTSFIPVFVLFFTKSRTRSQLRRVLYVLTVAWLVSEVTSWFLSKNNLNTFWVFHLYNSVSTVFYLIYFKLVLPEWISKKIIVIASTVYLLVYWTIISLTNGIFYSNTIGMIMTSLIPFVLSLLTFYSIAKESRYADLLSEPVYWVTSSILIHFGLGLVALVSLEFLSSDEKLLAAIWPLVLISNIIHNIIISIGIWKTNQV
jgi:hypothetical protein